ncbi:unnamed protein product [Anisakis simplex]|uniref:Disease resistance R13L4/SHOC-2-like LRR domain-containing protein n=1 Tax=Anisakis simplex TaxID=6269 RepID=A0A3P6NW73_ANISI|nr:unnamed protein product [Anisakis simplex]
MCLHEICEHFVITENKFGSVLIQISENLYGISYVPQFLHNILPFFFRMNRLSILPRGFGSFQSLEVLDLTYNNLSERSLPGNFFFMTSLRALYLGDNDFEYLPSDVENLSSLQILVLRENDLVALPKEIAKLYRLRELHIQGNRLTVLPPELASLDLIGPKQVFRLENNPWVQPIAEELVHGPQALMDYLRSDTYKYQYGRQESGALPVPPKSRNKDKKISRQQNKQGC